MHRWTPSDCCQKDDQRLAEDDTADDADDGDADDTVDADDDPNGDNADAEGDDEDGDGDTAGYDDEGLMTKKTDLNSSLAQVMIILLL